MPSLNMCEGLHLSISNAQSGIFLYLGSVVNPQIAFERMLSESISLPRFNCLDTYKFYLPFCVVAFVSKFYFREISRRGLIVSGIQLRLSVPRICIRWTLFNMCQVNFVTDLKFFRHFRDRAQQNI